MSGHGHTTKAGLVGLSGSKQVIADNEGGLPKERQVAGGRGRLSTRVSSTPRASGPRKSVSLARMQGDGGRCKEPHRDRNEDGREDVRVTEFSRRKEKF